MNEAELEIVHALCLMVALGCMFYIANAMFEPEDKE